MLLFGGFFPSRSYCLDLDWEINAGMEIEIFGIIEIAVLPCRLFRMKFEMCGFALETESLWHLGCTVFPWQLVVMEFGIAVLPCQVFRMKFGILAMN